MNHFDNPSLQGSAGKQGVVKRYTPECSNSFRLAHRYLLVAAAVGSVRRISCQGVGMPTKVPIELCYHMISDLYE